MRNKKQEGHANYLLDKPDVLSEPVEIERVNGPSVELDGP